MARGAGQSLAGATRLVLAAMLAAWLGTPDASAGEVCRFAGSSDYAGQIAVTAAVAAIQGGTRVDVAVTFEATTLPWLHIHYLIEEISTWRAGEMQSVAVNNRYFIGDHIVRQQWDEFQRGPDGMQARRVQAKTLDDFRLKHPGFVQHWDPATFTQPWLGDYRSASPERRPDLDLKGSPLPAGLSSPFAMAFYWIRWLPPGGRDVPVFLPGFKANRLVELPVAPAGSADAMLWRAPVRYPNPAKVRFHPATAWTSADGHLRQLALDLHLWSGSAQGLIHEQGCEGAPVVPADLPR